MGFVDSIKTFIPNKKEKKKKQKKSARLTSVRREATAAAASALLRMFSLCQQDINTNKKLIEIIVEQNDKNNHLDCICELSNEEK